MDAGVPQSKVPRFASFRPKLPPGSNPESRAARAQGTSHHVRARESEERHRQRPRNAALSLGGRHRRRSPDLKIQESPLEPCDGVPETYTIDIRGDNNNVSYGSADKYSVPLYRRSGDGQVLGLATNIRIDRHTSDHANIVLDVQQRRFLQEKHPLAAHYPKTSTQLRLVKINDEYHLSELNEDYLPLRASKRRKIMTESPSDGEDGQDYRCIVGKAKSRTACEDSDLESASGNSDTDLPSIEYEARKKNVELSGRVQAEPKNVDAWLALIRHQDSLIQHGRDRDCLTLSSAEQKSNAEVKLSMYQQALRNVDARSSDRERILLGLMEEGSKVWDSVKLCEKWEAVILENRDCIELLWPQYLDFHQTKTGFRYEECCSKFRDCLEVLKRSLTDASRKLDHTDKVYELLIYVIMRLTRFMYESGFHEQGIALWQALLEFNLFRPDHVRDVISNSSESGPLSNEAWEASFQEFWESEVPRIGEEGALGWASFAASSGPWRALETSKRGAPLSMPMEGFASWAEVEEEEEFRLRNPGRTIDDEEDIYHVILYSDIRDFLVQFPMEISSSLLLDAFLLFCGAPPRPSDGRNTGSQWWSRDLFLRNETLNMVESTTIQSLCRNMRDWLAPSTKAAEIPTAYDHSTGTMASNELITAGHLFEASGYTRAFKSRSDCLLFDSPWFLRVLKSLNHVLPAHEGLAEYRLAFEAQSAGAGNARKTAKRLLKERPRNIPLYNAYALLEAGQGNTSTSEHVFFTAITSSQSLGEGVGNDVIVLWRCWVWQALRCGCDKLALRRLLAIGNDYTHSLTECLAEPPGQTFSSGTVQGGLVASAAAVLKAKRALTEGFQHSLSHLLPYQAVLYAECLGLLAYLTAPPTSDNLTDAVSSLSTSSSLLFSRKMETATELLEQAKCLLIRYHLDHASSYKPALIREALADSVRQFPHNTMLLSMFAAVESRFRIDDRVRAIVRDVAGQGDEKQSIVQWLFLIDNEIHRGVDAGATQHSVRAIFQRAVESSSGKHSAALWRLYVLWEIACLISNREALEVFSGTASGAERAPISAITPGVQRVKAVFLSGLGQLPWCKKYIMLAFRTQLLQILTTEEKRMVYDLFGERELRLHVEIPQEVLNDPNTELRK